VKRSFWCVIAIVFLIGCSAPRERLTFPTTPLSRDDGGEWFDVNRNGKPDFHVMKSANGAVDRLEYDDNEDGVIDRAYRLSDYANRDVPHLIILLDSIPFQPVLDRWNAGDFRWFGKPQKVIPPFPSITETSFTRLLHAPTLPGVLDEYYDSRTGKIENGIWRRVKGWQEPWEQRVHYHAKMWEGGLSYLHPKEWYGAELFRMKQTLDESPDEVTLVYVHSTSGMLSRFGREGLDETLDGVRQLCLQLLYERHGALKVSMLADHGHNLTLSKNVHVGEILSKAGFHVTDALKTDNDVVLELDGLITYAGFHTRQPKKVADVLLARPETQLAMYMDGDRVIVRDAKGSAAIECHDQCVSYQPLDRDVLSYEAVIAKIGGDASHISDKQWFDATIDHEWPDAPRRIWDAFHRNAISPPELMVTFNEGSCAGVPSYEKYITMKSTHGGLNQVNSATFVMTMTGRIDHPLRTEEVMEALEPGYIPRGKRPGK
jgi:hypothetical protein